MKLDMGRPWQYGANERVRGVRIGRFVLRGIGVESDPASYLPIFQHCMVLRAEYSIVEQGVEFFALSPLFDALGTHPGDCITDRDVPRYEWECTTNPETCRVYSARPIRVS